MGNRLSAIATRTGDDGSTGLGDNSRVSKTSARIVAIGEVDELNSHIGLLLCETLPDDVAQLLQSVQHQLFNLGGELAMPGYHLLKDDGLLALDQALAHYNAHLPRLKEFILPAGSRPAAQAHVCRTVARRAERAVVAVVQSAGETLLPGPQQYLNRLSDLLFVLSRHLNLNHGSGEVYWQSERLKTQQDNSE
ncbi:cob(I)yrinic acid a,c-diamide adenosyltransferase [Lampropedia aestuarii]|uniref:Cobalamin adenosyltransferase n=1 Tax=Lampropedia aestuarii TaxID=2562762 RepID=A0A4S5BRB4_9BURK|nr:cob(I)yrinic acid a,c-diamide adenosyltransferase [Lampropedia aestuarii]THJ33733.1 cob(I)yrinic acid a,c-diamide adenosyltransferase [Lampropedia aestuarii]